MKPFVITHVLILSGPPKYENETKQFHLKLFPINKLPPNFSVKMTWGDAFLTYRDNDKLETACSRMFFQKTGKTWKCWPFRDIKSPQEAIRREVNS